jgi:hypothetical protein
MYRAVDLSLSRSLSRSLLLDYAADSRLIRKAGFRSSTMKEGGHKYAYALMNLLRQVCTRPRAAAGGIEDVVGEILRGGNRYSGQWWSGGKFQDGASNPSLNCALSVAKQTGSQFSKRVQLMETWASLCHQSVIKQGQAEAKSGKIKTSELRLIADDTDSSLFDDLHKTRPLAVLSITGWLEAPIQNPEVSNVWTEGARVRQLPLISPHLPSLGYPATRQHQTEYGLL